MFVVALSLLMVCYNLSALAADVFVANRQDILGWAESAYVPGIVAGVLMLG